MDTRLPPRYAFRLEDLRVWHVTGTPEDADAAFNRVEYRLDSGLIILSGMIGEKPPMGSHFYSFEHGELHHLHTVARPGG